MVKENIKETSINNIQILKSRAYDLFRAAEQIQREMAAVNNEIIKLEKEFQNEKNN